MFFGVCTILAIHIMNLHLPSRSSRLWSNYPQNPNDPNLSCYQLQNETWNCAQDAMLRYNIDNDDSY